MAKSGPALFLGLELATDQLRATIVDENLELVGVESIDFDSELPEYQCVLLASRFTYISVRACGRGRTGGLLVCAAIHGLTVCLYRTQGGIFTTPGDAYTTPVDMWVKALGESLSLMRNQTVDRRP
jgi:xylulokinase